MTSIEKYEVHTSQIEEISSWAEYEALVREPRFRGWMYRGQRSADWPVLSSLSRHLAEHCIHKDVWAIQERRILDLFRRKAHLFLAQPPAPTNYFQWLALMQHHGAPTRLIDFTWSPEVAAFFAMESATDGTCAVWAVGTPKLWNASYQIAGDTTPATALSLRDSSNYEQFYLSNTVPFASTDDPFVMNQRIIAQSGTFLVPGVLDLSVEQILSEKGRRNPRDWVVKIELDVGTVRSEGMAALYRMNMTDATLFPGLDGTARSLAYELERHWAFDPMKNEAQSGYELEFERLKQRRLE